MRRLILFIPLLALLVLAGCRTTHESLQQLTDIRDSVRIRDSIRLKDSLYVKTDIRDSLRIKDSTVIVKDADGNIVSQEHWHEKEHITHSSDSVAFYQAVARDAIEERNKALQQLKDATKVFKVEPTLMEKFKLFSAGFLTAIIIMLFVFFFWHRRKNTL